MNSKQLALKASGLIFEKKGYDVNILDLSNLTSFTDYFVICSADSDTQVKAISDEVERKLREQGANPWHREGYDSLNWVLLDYVDVVVHIFKKDSRQFYNLEKLWGDAPVIEVSDPSLQKVSLPTPVKKIKKMTAKKSLIKKSASGVKKPPKTSKK